jgi:hypothetical protein
LSCLPQATAETRKARRYTEPRLLHSLLATLFCRGRFVHFPGSASTHTRGWAESVSRRSSRAITMTSAMHRSFPFFRLALAMPFRAVSQLGVPQRLKPNSLQSIYVRAEARTLQDLSPSSGPEAHTLQELSPPSGPEARTLQSLRPPSGPEARTLQANEFFRSL